ncbi:MAG: hypothetical protein M3327_05205 [Actinomycetota bacterium]|nr:hypothetical protein [Actinomycetota bacterium]
MPTRRLRLRRPSPALAVACLALFVALGGVSYAAAVLPVGSVGTRQLRSGAVTKPKLRNRAVTTAKLRNGAVTSAKIARRAVQASDLAPGLVTGPPAVAKSETARVLAGATTQRTFVDLPGARAALTLPADVNRMLLLVRFSAESSCSGGAGAQYCPVRVVVDGMEALPAAGLDFAFDSTDSGSETGSSWESHAMERTTTVGPGAHTVQVQWAVTSAATTFRLDDWVLAIEKFPVG